MYQLLAVGVFTGGESRKSLRSSSYVPTSRHNEMFVLPLKVGVPTAVDKALAEVRQGCDSRGTPVSPFRLR